MSERLERLRKMASIVIKVLNALDILHLLGSLHLPHGNRSYYCHPETTIATAKRIVRDNELWRKLRSVPDFHSEYRKMHYRRALRQLLKEVSL